MLVGMFYSKIIDPNTHHVILQKLKNDTPTLKNTPCIKMSCIEYFSDNNTILNNIILPPSQNICPPFLFRPSQNICPLFFLGKNENSIFNEIPNLPLTFHKKKIRSTKFQIERQKKTITTQYIQK